jgi:tetratricopeptide (TPR) repeat protein
MWFIDELGKAAESGTRSVGRLSAIRTPADTPLRRTAARSVRVPWKAEGSYMAKLPSEGTLLEANAMRLGQWKGRGWARRAAVLGLVLTVAASAIGCSSLKEHLFMKDAAKAYKAGKYEEAAKNFQAALKINPRREVNWKYLAFSYWSLVEPGSKAPKDEMYTDKALEAFQKYLSLVGRDDTIQDYIINLYINQNRLEQGIKFYEAELRKDPKDGRVLQTLAAMYAKMGNFEKALEYYQKKAELTPNDVNGWLMIGALCWDKSYRKDAPDEQRKSIVETGMGALNRALAIDPLNFNGHLFKNLLYRQKADLAKNAAENEKDRRLKKELLAQADEFIKMADQEKDTALAIRKGTYKPGTPPPPSSTTPAAN